LVVALACYSCAAASVRRRTIRKKQQKAKAAAHDKKERKVKLPRVRRCRFCEVEIVSKAFLESHVAGKKHKKLAGSCAPDSCWVWVTKEPAAEPSQEMRAESEAPAALTSEVDDAADGWEVVDLAAKKKARAAAAAARKRRDAAAPAEEVRQSLRVHRRCDECGIRARDGATIETDPDNESRAYCTACWDRYYNGPPEEAAAAPEAAPKRHVTRWS